MKAIQFKVFIALTWCLIGLFHTATPAQTAKTAKKPKRIAIAPFSRSQDAQTVTLLESELTNGLVTYCNFEMVDRLQLSQVLTELQINNSELVDPKAAQKVGKLIGADYIVSGEVLDYAIDRNAGGDEVEVSAHVQLIEVSTGNVSVSTICRGYANLNSSKMRAFSGLLSAMSGQKQDLPALTDSQRFAMYQSAMPAIARQFAERLNQMSPLSGYIVANQNGRVAINLGTATGIKRGQEFLVYTEDRIIKDPVSGEKLGAVEQLIGFLTVVSVEEKLAWCEVNRTFYPLPGNKDTVATDKTPVPDKIKSTMPVRQYYFGLYTTPELTAVNEMVRRIFKAEIERGKKEAEQKEGKKKN